MKSSDYSPYRWIILTAFMLITVSIEIQWLSHAAVARPAAVFYQGQFDAASFMNIDFLAMVYMLAFLLFSFPASYVIDTFGTRAGLSIGAALLGIFSLLKAFLATSFTGVVIAQVGLAIAQPFILNAVTAVTARWFPLYERGMAAGFLALAQYIGIIIAMLVSPLLIVSDPDAAGYGNGFERMLWIYGIISLVTALAALFLIREPSATTGDSKHQTTSFREGMKLILGRRDMVITLMLFLIGLGIFNAISSMTDAITERAGVEDSDGLIGGVMLIGGILGALIIPTLSDKFRKRKPFLVLCIAGMLPGVAGLTFAANLSADPSVIYTISLISSGLLGFFVMSAGPLGFQYAAEVTYPAPESASQGILLWVGQLSGMIFVAGMSMQNNAHLGPFMQVFSLLCILALVLAFLLKESPAIRTTS